MSTLTKNLPGMMFAEKIEVKSFFKKSSVLKKNM